jgi:hypothetical protein
MKSSAKKLMSENLFKISSKKDWTRFFSQLMVHGYDFAKRFWPQRVLKKNQGT